MTDMNRRILCVDDEEAILKGLRLNVRKEFEMSTANSGAEGLEVFQNEGPFAVVVCTWFLLRTAHWRAIARVLAPGGLVVYVQPTLGHAQRHDHPSRRFLADFAELGPMVRDAGVEALRLEEGWDARGNHTARLLGRLRRVPGNR